nr:MAG TPA: hypothetical protein [Caudoviricetes sp.]
MRVIISTLGDFLACCGFSGCTCCHRAAAVHIDILASLCI